MGSGRGGKNDTKHALGLHGRRRRRRKVVVMGEGAAVCCVCVQRVESIKQLYHHIAHRHSDREWKAFFAGHKTATIDVGGRNKDLLSGWKVTGKRGRRPGSKVVANGHRVKSIDEEELHEIAECLLLLASGPPLVPSSKEVEEAGVEALMKMQQDSRAGGCRDQVRHPSKEVEVEVEAAAMEDGDFKCGFMVGEPQRLGADFQSGYFMVHDFDLNEDPASTPPP